MKLKMRLLRDTSGIVVTYKDLEAMATVTMHGKTLIPHCRESVAEKLVQRVNAYDALAATAHLQQDVERALRDVLADLDERGSATSLPCHMAYDALAALEERRAASEEKT